MKRILFFTPVLFGLVLVQTSFLSRLSVWGIVPNVVFLFVAGVALREHARSMQSIVLAFVGGFFLDMMSGQFIGLWVLLLLCSVLIIKIIKGKYVWLPFFHKA